MKSCSLRLVASLFLVALALLSSVSANAADEKVDIVGLRLGMTLDEATEAIRKYNPELKIQPPVRKVLQYRVANETRKTEPFVSYLFAVSGKKQKDDIYVYFSLPPGEPRAIAISRMHNNFDPPILRDTYYKALTGKYGTPAATETDKQGAESRRMYWFQWHIGDGKTQCVRHVPGGRNVEGKFGTLASGTVERGEVLPRIMNASTGKMYDPAAKDPSDCAVLLTYQLNYDPLFAAIGTLIDVAGAAKSEQEMSKWIDELARKGEAEIRGSKAAPKL